MRMRLLLTVLGLLSSAEGGFLCSGQRLKVDSSCGDTLTLPCQFSWVGSPPPAKYELVWQLRRYGVDFVVHDDDMKTPANQQQHSKFTNRTSVQEGWRQHGNVTLQLTDVSDGDQGVYTCDLLTTSPYARKICMEIHLTVKTGCGTNRSQDVHAGDPVQLSCLPRQACLLRTKRGITWRFTAANSEKEVELPSTAIAENRARQISFSADGTLILQEASPTDSGTYCCYLMGTEKCSGIQLRVLDVKVNAPVPGPVPDSPYLLYWLAVVGAIVFMVLVAVGVKLGKATKPPGERNRPAEEINCGQMDINEDSVNSITPLISGQNIKDLFRSTSKQSDKSSSSLSQDVPV